LKSLDKTMERDLCNALKLAPDEQQDLGLLEAPRKMLHTAAKPQRAALARLDEDWKEGEVLASAGE